MATATAPQSAIEHYKDTYPYIAPSKYANSLTGKVVLLTGAGRGIGKATALALAAAGALVACVARTQADIDAVVSEIASKGYPKAVAITSDMSDGSAAAPLVRQVESSLGPIDILLNNAGTLWASTFEHDADDLERWWKVLEVNVRGPMALIHAVLPSMIARGHGTIITVTSKAVSLIQPGFSSYAASKAAISKAHEILDLELRQHGIHTYTVHPGSIPGTGLGDGNINHPALEVSPWMRQLMHDLPRMLTDTLALAADTLVALAADPRAQVLSGRYVDATEDLGQVIAETEKGEEGRVVAEGLYRVKIDQL